MIEVRWTESSISGIWGMTVSSSSEGVLEFSGMANTVKKRTAILKMTRTRRTTREILNMGRCFKNLTPF